MRRYPLLSLLLLLTLLLGAGAVGGAGRSQVASQPMPQRFFDLTVSLEWQPGVSDLALAGCASSSATDYMADLKDGLTQTAAYLYSYSAGQLALGNVTVYTGGDHWDSADLRVLASSSYRPSAFIGGIVDAPTQNISATSGMTKTVFYPATIFLGRLWDGQGSRCGAWSQPAGWRTIGHEWAHYALFLYDEYYNVDTDAEQFCTSTGLDLHAMLSKTGGSSDSLMAYQYSADQFWLGGSSPPKADPPPWSCKDTPQARMQGEPDWKTIARFYPVAAPANLPIDIQFAGSPAATGLNIIIPAPAATDTSADVRLATLPALPTPRLVGEAYLIHPNTKGDPQRIIGQGKIIAGEATPPPFWGVQTAAKDRALVVVPNWATGKRYTFPASYSAPPALNVAAPNLLVAPESTWRPNISVIPHIVEAGGISNVTSLTVRLTDCAGKSQRPQVVFCPAGGDCSAPTLMNSISSGTFEYTFFFGAAVGPFVSAPLFGYIYVRNPGNLAETAIWYQIGGGVGPAIGEGHAPLADSEVDASPEPGASAPPNLDDSRLLYTPAMSCNTAGFIFPAGILGIAGTPVELQPVVADGNGGQPWGSNPFFALPQLRVRLGYSQDLLDRLGIGEDQLVVLRLDKSKRSWEQIPTSAQSRSLNWIAAQARTFDGQGAVYALGYRPARVLLPLIRR